MSESGPEQPPVDFDPDDSWGLDPEWVVAQAKARRAATEAADQAEVEAEEADET